MYTNAFPGRAEESSPPLVVLHSHETEYHFLVATEEGASPVVVLNYKPYCRLAEDERLR